MMRSAARCAFAAALSFLIVACGGSNSGGTTSQSSAGSGAQLTGAGSSFVYPFFSKAFYQYNKQHPDVTVNYQSIGSGAGIEQFTQKTIDFGASDVPMNAEELKRAGEPVVQIPIALGGESIVYNLPGFTGTLRLGRDTLAAIYLGKISNWSDPKIAAINPGAKLPNLPIAVVHRSDGSGTTYIFTDYLSSASPDWLKKVGRGKSVSWPAPSSVGGKGNEGVAGQVRNAPGAIGYVELAYAKTTNMPAAMLQNKAGQFVADTADSVRAAAASKPAVSASSFSIVDAPGAKSYPIAGYTWVMLYQHPKDAARAKMVDDVLSWTAGRQGQLLAGTLDYVPLPAPIQSSALRALKSIHS